MAYKKTSAMDLFHSSLNKTEPSEQSTQKVKNPKQAVKKETVITEDIAKATMAESQNTKDDQIVWQSSSLHIGEENVAFMKKWAAFSGKTQKDLFYELFQEEYEAHKDEINDFHASFDIHIEDERKKTKLFGIQLPKEQMTFLTKYTALCGVNKSVYVNHLISEKRKTM